VRKSIHTLQQSDPNNILQTFHDAVEQMQNMSNSKSRSYDSIASIHGNTSWNCEHGNWLFLPWHRAYLYHFEEICRELTGNDNFAIPYWNWIQHRSLPDIFGPNWSPSGSSGSSGSNPLYTQNRTLTTSDSISSSVATPANMQAIQQDPNFFRYAGGSKGASGRISWGSGKNESPPHNALHGEVGGSSSDHMRGPDAAFDPVFWTHHSMIDCLWYDWNIKRGNPNTNNQSWLSASLYDGSGPKFIDKDGNTVQSIETLESLLMAISYDYEDCMNSEASQEPVEDPEAFLESGADVELNRIESFPVQDGVSISVQDPVSIETEISVSEIEGFLSGEKQGRLLLRLIDIDPPAYPANLSTRVFINHPEVTEDTSVDDPRYVSYIPFFVAPEDQPNGNKFVDSTDTLRSLYENGSLSREDTLSFQFVSLPDGELESNGRYEVGELRLAVTQSRIDGEIVEY